MDSSFSPKAQGHTPKLPGETLGCISSQSGLACCGVAALTEGPHPWRGGRHCPLSRMCPRGPCFWGCFLLLCLGSALRECQGFSALPPLPMGHLPHVEQYEVVQPFRLPISGALNELSSRPTLYPETIRYLLGLRGNNFTLHLRRNRHLVGSDYTETYTLANGTEVTKKPHIGQHCFYQGHVEGYQNSVASISTCLGIRGFFKADSIIHLIEPLDQQKHGSPQERQGGLQGRHGITKGRHGITQGKHGITQGKHGITEEKHGSPQGRHGITQEKHGITQGKHGITEEKHGSPQGRHGITQEKHGITQGKHGITEEKHGSPQGRHGITQEKHGITKEKHGSPQGRHGITQEKHGITQGKHGITEEKHGSPQGRHGITQEKHGITQGKHGITEEKHGSPQGRHGITQEKHGITKEKHGSPQGRHGSPQEKHGITQEKHSSPQEKHGIIQEKHGSPHENHDSTNKRYNSTDKGYGITQGRHGSTHEKHDSDLERHRTTQSSLVSHQERHDTTQEKHISDGHRSDQGKHAIYKQENLKGKHRTCGVSKVSLKGELETMMEAVSMPKNWIPGSIPKDTHYVELFVVVDHGEYKKYKSLKKLRHRVKEIVNHVDRLYQEINFRVILIGLEIWDKGNKAAIDSDIEATLSSFLKWRDSDLIRKKKHDNAQLITGVSFGGTDVGLARLASMCTEGSGGVSHDYSMNPFGVATTLAHEMGHNLGMNHDENIRGCQCEKNKQEDRCIMTSTFGTVLPKRFSSCSKYNLHKFLAGNIFSSSCLNNFPALEKLEEGPVCGNNFLERGEECDCGLPEECLNQCCNPKSCRLAPGAECTEGKCCQACQVMPAGEICREAQNACDLAEYCDGKQPKCPENVYKENGTPCWNGYCYNGACPTYKQQCQALWGRGADVSTDKCFLLNLPKGCTEAFYPSKQGLNKCRFLSCSRPSPKRSTRHLCSFLLEDESCDLAITKSENHSPFQMVAPGTKCGKKKVCYRRRCQGLSIYGARNCSSKCHDRGVCNHKRECHCDPGWAPPDCQKKLSELKEELLSQDRISLGRGLPLPKNIKDRSLLVGVLVALTLMAVLAILVFVFYKWKMGRKEGITAASPIYRYKRETIGYP
ncbi:disintegrin and metalloproteinase domain-containing protein 8-like [Trichosurus vulpecula]|uniref:disintegrin and metalloproteinase domain-containing protein 8-like n=1 Tax=Trichosurus vulpecula TaxID=9337 RepID=UPI00186AF277|nr:disintegrin and metalloproteinase domain-containing protein 8-like [Trichosurus vulpecula]